MNVVEKIAERFGGIRPMARSLKLAESTVRYWVNIGHISGTWLQPVFDAGQALDPPLTAADFFQPQEAHDDGTQTEERSRRPTAAD
jgi:hypothetical protein